MTLRLGVDDTDSPRGGCTTYVLTELLALAAHHGLDLIGEPRLVRLNPNIPWKTRGNAALSARFGKGSGRPRTVGEIGGVPLLSYARGGSVPRRREAEFLEAAWATVRSSSREGEAGTDPALVATRSPLPSELYDAAVREVVSVASVARTLAHAGAWTRTCGSARGIVGAAAAIAWTGRRATWEAISYRRPDRYGLPREVDGASVRAAQRTEPDLFLCFDRRTRRTLVAPHTPCPILFGLRGVTPEAPLAARPRVRSEPVERWVLFRTNQGSGDHLAPRGRAAWSAFQSGWVRGRVPDLPDVLRGGHVRFSVVGPRGRRVDFVAFEPTKTLPRIARQLRPGDRVRVWGSRARDGPVRTEGIEVLAWHPHLPAVRPPRCPACRRGARSMGRLRGYRCPGCRRRWSPEAGVHPPRAPPAPLGVYHPTPSARRHLAPLGPEN